MLCGKVAALAGVVFVMVIALFGVDAASSTVVALIDGKTLAYPEATTIVKAIVACFLIFGFWAMFGLSLATLFQQSALAIGLGLAYALVVEVLIFGLLAGLGGGFVQQGHQWVPPPNTRDPSPSFRARPGRVV